MKIIKKKVEFFVSEDGKEFSDRFKCETHEEALRAIIAPPKDSRVAAVEKEWEENPTLHDEFLARIKEQNKLNMQTGVNSGWFDGVDEKWNPIPFPMIISKADFGPKDTMAHVLAKLEIFPSISEARKNGWNKPITLGEFWLFKNTKRIQII